MAQGVKNPATTQETQEMWIQPLGWEDPLEKEMGTCPMILAWKIPWTEEPGGYSPKGSKESDTTKHIGKAEELIRILR